MQQLTSIPKPKPDESHLDRHILFLSRSTSVYLLPYFLMREVIILATSLLVCMYVCVCVCVCVQAVEML